MIFVPREVISGARAGFGAGFIGLLLGQKIVAFAPPQGKEAIRRLSCPYENRVVK
jgi:hypothetical protein